MGGGTVSANLFADAKAAEYSVEHIVVGDGAGKTAQFVKGAAHINGHEVGRQSAGKTLLNAVDVVCNPHHQVVMAGVGQQGAVGHFAR